MSRGWINFEPTFRNSGTATVLLVPSPALVPRMEPDSSIEQAFRYVEYATDEIVQYLTKTKKEGRLVYPLVELAEETALDPRTTEVVMTRLGSEEPFMVRRRGGRSGETRWLFRGSASDVDQQRRR